MGGEVLKINSALIYPYYGEVFTDFVNYFEKFRSINDVYKTLGKLMINSFYGRTGLRIRESFSFFVQKKEKLDELLNLTDKNYINILSINEINDI
jgi:hypothetical protein